MGVQRAAAASNAYSWWYASHIRTKQSKWLDHSLHDMEEKVQCMLKMIEQEGDSFAKRAEMYYKRRPELISSVEEAYRAFRALAERYDKLSKDLHTANHTIATVIPEQIQMVMEEDEDDFCSPKLSKNPQDSPRFPRVFAGFQTDSKNLQESGGPKFAKAPKKPFQTKNLSNNAGDADTKAKSLEEIEN
ncbi:unnamed protein product, partial [Cuscuta epithymum]